MIGHTGRFIQILIVGILLAAISAMSMAAQEVPKRILVVQSQPSGDLFHSAIVSHLIGELPRQTPRVQVLVEALDASRLSLWHTPAFRNYLELKYGSDPFDIVVTVGSPAANAMRGPGAGYVSTTPWVVVNAGPGELEQLRKLPNVIPIGNVGAEFAHNMELITTLLPDIQHLLVVGRAATPQIQADIQDAIANARQHYVSVERLDEGRDTVLIERLRQAPANTAVFLAGGQRGRNPTAKVFTWALTGGSTPQAWYRWCVAKDALSPGLLAATHWFTSDERHVPLASEDSNFGHADRELSFE